MQPVHLFEIVMAGLAGAAVGVVACRFHARQQIGSLKQRLVRSEEARNGEVARSAHAREQISQLSNAISEMRRTHQPGRVAKPAQSTPEERRAAAERALELAGSGNNNNKNASRDAPKFAETQPMEY